MIFEEEEKTLNFQQDGVSTLEFDPECYCQWGHVSCMVDLLVKAGKLDEGDCLRKHADEIIPKLSYSWNMLDKNTTEKGVQVGGVDVVSPTFFENVTDWLKKTGLDGDFLEEDGALLVSSYSTLARYMVSDGSKNHLKQIAA